MLIDVLSLFPEYLDSPLNVSILKCAIKNDRIKINARDIRDFGLGKHKKVDDRPFGGGPGMVMMAEPVLNSIRSVKTTQSKVVYLSPQGKQLDAKLCKELAEQSHLILLCGHYEGIDQRVFKEIDEEVSIGPYVLTSGLPAAMVLIDSVARFIPGVLGNEDSHKQDSFEVEGQFDHPHYTHPREFEGEEVPAVLYGGHQAKISQWRQLQAKQKQEALVNN